MEVQCFTCRGPKCVRCYESCRAAKHDFQPLSHDKSVKYVSTATDAIKAIRERLSRTVSSLQKKFEDVRRRLRETRVKGSRMLVQHRQSLKDATVNAFDASVGQVCVNLERIWCLCTTVIKIRVALRETGILARHNIVMLIFERLEKLKMLRESRLLGKIVSRCTLERRVPLRQQKKYWEENGSFSIDGSVPLTSDIVLRSCLGAADRRRVGRYVTNDAIFKIRYYGLPLVLKVASLATACKQEQLLHQTDSADTLTDRIADMGLSGSGDEPMRREPSTPIGRPRVYAESPLVCDGISPVPMDTPKCAASDLPFCRVTAKTLVTVDACTKDGIPASPVVSPCSNVPCVTFGMIGGLSRQIEMLRDFVQLPLEHPALFEQYGLALPKGVLLYGAPGTGKTLLAHAIATEVKATFFSLNGPEIWSKYFGETENKLNSLFKEAVDKSPSIIFIDELDALCPRRERSQSETEKRVLATLLLLIDSIEHYPDRRIVLLGATSKPDAIDPALRRPGRFDREVELTIPTSDGRLQILTKLMAAATHDLSPSELAHVADTTHGYVGADLVALCQEAGMRAIKRHAALGAATGKTKGQITARDFAVAMAAVQPSAMREVVADVPKVRWSDIGGQTALKESLRQSVEWPLKHKEAFRRLGVKAPRGVLLYGPPGCSKTMFAKALASESGLNFIPIKGPELFSKWVGESEKAVREVFRKARAAAPSIVFFDEIDALAGERGGSSSGGSNVGDRVLAQLLTEMDGVEALDDVIVVAATNRPDMIDKALLRPGRLDRIIYVPLPDDETRRGIIDICSQRIPVAADFDRDLLVERTTGYSGAEVTAVCNEAGLAAMKENVEAKEVEMRHFLAALDMVRPRTSAAAVRHYEAYAKATSGGGVL